MLKVKGVQYKEDIARQQMKDVSFKADIKL